MSHDDLHVVMYKILAYLYSCMKNGEKPVFEHYSHNGDVLNIPYSYWARVISELQNNGYVKGFVITETWGGSILVTPSDPYVTVEGVQYLQDNSVMKKALAFLKETKSSLPFL